MTSISGVRLGILGNSKHVSSCARKMASPTYALVEHTRGRVTTGPFGNQSRGGHTSDDYLTVVDALLATAPRLVLIGDETNGIHALDQERIKANYDWIIDHCLSHPSVERLFLELTPRGRHLKDRFEPARLALNAYLAAKASDRIVVVDPQGFGYDCADPAVCLDGTHPSTYGALKVVGPGEARAIEPYLPAQEVFPERGEIAGNINICWEMTGAGGVVGQGVSGVVADGWEVSSTADLLVMASKGVMNNGQAAQVLTISGRCVDDRCHVQLRRVQAFPLKSGQFFEGWAEYDIRSKDGTDPAGLIEFKFVDFNAVAYGGKRLFPARDGFVPRHGGVARLTPVAVVKDSAFGALILRLAFARDTEVDCVVKVGRRFVVPQEREAYAAPFDQSQTVIGYEPPTITGRFQVGTLLTAHVGSFSGGALGYEFRWMREGVPIKGAARPTYDVQETDKGRMLGVMVTATNALGSATATSISSLVT